VARDAAFRQTVTNASAIVSIGHGVDLWWDDDGRVFSWRHPACRAWARLRFRPDPESTGHELIDGSPDNTDALTIRGSLLCPKDGCGFHGHITRGKWVPA
jgi:hypothetical protein